MSYLRSPHAAAGDLLSTSVIFVILRSTDVMNRCTTGKFEATGGVRRMDGMKGAQVEKEEIGFATSPFSLCDRSHRKNPFSAAKLHSYFYVGEFRNNNRNTTIYIDVVSHRYKLHIV